MNCTDVVKRCFVVLSVAALAVPAQPQSELPPDSVLAEEEILLVDPEAVPEEEIQTVDPQKVPKEPPEEEALPPIETMPELTEFVEAEYPEEVYAEGIEGAVLLDLLVSDSGTVDSAAVVESLHPVLDSTAREAARQFRFTPAIAGGDSVPVLLQYEYRFSLREIVRKLDKYENFTGRLLEMGTRAPISDALVVIEFLDTASDTSIAVPFGVYLERIGQFEGQYIEEDRLVTTTDSDGYFHFYSIPTGPVGITVPVPGYEQLKERETVTPGEAIVATYFLRRTSYSDYEIVVYGKTEKKEVSRRQLTLNEVKKIPGLGGDAVKVVQAMPGVSRPAFGSGEIVVRGAPSWDSQYYLDGLTIPLLYHFGGLKSTYISDGLQSVDFYPGGFGTRYGGGTAGVIEIKSRAPKTDRLHGVVDMSTLDGSLMLEGPVNDKVSIFASARKSFLGEILTQFYENTDVDLPITAAPYYWDYTVRADMDLGDREKLFINLFGARDSLGVHFPRFRGGSDEVDEATDQISSMIQFHRATLGHDMAFNDKWENSLRTAIARVWSNNSVLGMIKAENSAIGAALRNELAYKHSDKLRMNIGIDAELSLLDLLLVIPGQGNVLMRDTSDDWLFGVIGGYANVEYKPVDNLTIIPGLRYDFYSELDYYGPWLPEFWDYSFENTTRFAGEPSLRLTSRYTVTEGHTVKGALGNYSQSPEPQGQVIHPTWGDPTLPATRAAHYVLGYEWQITDLIHADIQGYLNRQWSIPRMANDSDLVETGNPDQLWLSDGRGRMHGLEFMLRHDQGERFFGWIAYTLSRSERFDKHEDEWALYGNDETHHLQLVGSWRLPHSFETGFRLRYVTGKPTTPVIGRVDNELYNFYEPIYGETNSERVDPFFQLDLRVDKKFIFQNWILSSYLDLQNISWLLYKSPEYEMYDNFYDEKTTVSNVLTPAIGLRAEF